MNIEKFKQIRVGVAFFVGFLVSIAVSIDSTVLALAAIITGIIFLVLARSKAKVVVDERDKTIREKAANITYAIFAPTIATGALLLILFGKGRYLYLESLGMVLAYLTCFLIVVYAISFWYLNKKYGGGNEL